MNDCNNPKDGEPDFKSLVEAACTGDEVAREELLSTHMESLTRFVRQRLGRRLRVRETSQDLVQSVCREALSDLAAFEYRGEASFRRWLFARAENKIRARVRFWRRDKRDESSEEHNDVLEQLATFATPSRQLAAREDLEKLERAFGSLSPDHQKVIMLSRIEGLSHGEIAGVMQRSEVAVRQLLTRSLALLATRIGGQ